MQTSIIVILITAAFYLMYDDSSKKAELTRLQSTLGDLQAQVNNQQQAAQTAEMTRLRTQIQQLTQDRDRSQLELQRLTQDRDRSQQEIQRLAAGDRARAEIEAARAKAANSQQNWLQQRAEQGPKLDNPATPVGPQRPYSVDRYGVRHYY